MNSLYQQLNQQSLQNNGQLGQIKNMLNMLRNSSNPNAMLQSMINQNPQMKQVMNLINESGGDPKTAFYNKAKQMGVNPDDILNMLK